MILMADNPEPAILPQLGVWQCGDELQVSSAFPNVPMFLSDAWCFESPVDFQSADRSGKGGLELRHRVRNHDDVNLITSVTAEPGSVEFSSRLVWDDKSRIRRPADIVNPNICWQLKRSPNFMSRPDPYPDFVSRCFIFTHGGLTFLVRRTPRPGCRCTTYQVPTCPRLDRKAGRNTVRINLRFP